MDFYFVGGGNFGQLFWVIFMLGYSLLLLTIDSSFAFNIDVKNVKSVIGPTGSQFGYSLIYDALKESLLVGAPKEQTNIRGKNIPSGAIHTCLLDRLNRVDCTPTSYAFPQFFEDPKSAESEGYGLSIGISGSGNVSVCAPQWKDTRFKKGHHIFVPGRCVLDTDGKVSDVSPYYDGSTKPELYLDHSSYFHGFALFGFSSDSTKESTFAYGAPGLTMFEGGIFIKDFTNYEFSATVPKDFIDTMYSRTAYGYLGYEVKIGKFCERDICVAAGAPHLHTIGTVRLYRWVNKEVLYNFQNLKGEKEWSYFGSVLCAVDTDQDTIDELLVGAPYYGDDNRNSLDTGKVYVYKRKKSEKIFSEHMTLQGSGNKYSRFGSAIQKIGDINLDNYQDVVIGAPGEENDSGCIYIYLGSPRGITSKFSQKICATEIQGKPLKLFGSSISTPIKQQRSPYPVIAVSSYATDTFVLFNTRVIVKPKATINATPNPIDLNKKCAVDGSSEPCTTFDVCYSQQMDGVPTTKLDFIVNIEVDTQRLKGVQQRVQFTDPTGKLVDSLGDLAVFGVDKDGFCQKFNVVTNKDQVSNDRFTPIEFKVIMKIDNTRSPLDPILDPTVPSTFTYMVHIANDCGSDNVCNVDLSLAGAITYSHKGDWPYVVIGHTKEMQVDLTISNSEETSYGTGVRVVLSQPIRFLRFQSDVIKQCNPVTSESKDFINTVVVCYYYQPLKKDSSMDISIVFDTTDVALDQKTITAIAKATILDTKYSREKNFDDNTKEMITSVYIVADVNVFGSSSPQEITLKNSKTLSLTAQEPVTKEFTHADNVVNPIVLNHKYQMKNMGPSFLPKTRMYVTIPAYLPDSTQLISRVSIQLQLGDQPVVSCTDIVKEIEGEIGVVLSTSATVTTAITDHTVSTHDDNSSETTTQWIPGGGVLKRRKREADDYDPDDDFAKTYSLTCETSFKYCVIFRCDLESDTSPGDHVSLNVTLDVDRENIPIPEGFTSFILQLKSLVQQPKHILFKPWSRESKQQASARTNTIFHVVESGGEINIWIIIGSVIAGLLLILIIALIFWKLGFFKRKMHHEMEEWKRKSVRVPSATLAGSEN